MTTNPGRLVEEEDDLAAIVRGMRTLAVLGMKGEEQSDEPAYAIPQMLSQRGFKIIPVNPKLTAELGQKAYPDLASVPEPFDLLDVFRRSDAIPEVAGQVLALPPERRPRVVWLQSGIRHDEAARSLVAAGLDVVQDRCLGVYASRYARR